MKPLSRVGLGLSALFICLLLALVAEIYYLIWWKRKIIRNDDIKEECRSPTRREFFLMLCWRKPYKSSVSDDLTGISTTQIHHQLCNEPELELRPDNKEYYGAELIITGPPRFLYTIREETREDLESEDGKSCIEKRSLSNLLKVEHSSSATPPCSTPLSSPPFLTPMGSCHSSQSWSEHNPFSEAYSDAEFNKIVRLSPPPKFKFLRDAEEKLHKKIMLMEQGEVQGDAHHRIIGEEEDGTFVRIIIAKNNAVNDGKSIK